MKRANAFVMNTEQAYWSWTMIDTIKTMHTRPTDHSQLETTYPQTRPLGLIIQHRSLCKYSARGEVRHAGKSSTDMDPLEQEQDHCKVDPAKD